MKRLVAVFALIVFSTSSTLGGVIVVFCPIAKCDTQPAPACQIPVPEKCRPCCGRESACPIENPKPEPDQTRVILLPLLAVDALDVQRCSRFAGGTGLTDFREEQLQSRHNPGLTAPVATVGFTLEFSAPSDIGASRPPGVPPGLLTVVLRC